MNDNRTIQQNRALHKFFELLADELNNAGLDQRKVLKETISIPWTQTAVKDQIWKPIQRAMYSKGSTTELDKDSEITHIHKVIMRELGEKFGVDYIPFPKSEQNLSNLNY